MQSKTDAAEPDRRRAARGRPRDPELERKVFDAALELYGREGWSGFSFDVIARAAGVGKNAIYRRWPTKGALLSELLQERWVAVDRIDCGNLRDDLRALCRMLFVHMAGPLGSLGLQLQLDIVRHEAVAAALAGYRRDVNRNARTIVRRAIARREVPEGTSTTLVLDVIAGAVLNHVFTTPPDLRQEMMAQSEDYIERLVAVMLRGLIHAGNGVTGHV